MSLEAENAGFIPEVARPLIAWFFACLVAGLLLGGFIQTNLLKTEWLHLHEIDWLGLLSEEPKGMLFTWAWATGIIALVTSVPALVLVLLVRWLEIPRGWADVLIPAFLPYFLFAGFLGGDFQVAGESLWLKFVDLIPIGALSGLTYWLFNGTPTSRIQ